MMNHIQNIKNNGVVGAGGAGFPTHIKLGAKADIVIVNGAECEPLLRVDQQLMEHYPQDVVNGLKIAMEQVEAKNGYIGLKAKYKNAVKNLTEIVKGEPNIELRIIKDFYPAGDEVQMVYEITKRVVPIAGIPLDVGVVVTNALTAINIARNVPVTERVITITGDVATPQTLNVPIGVSYRDLIITCGGPKNNKNHSIILGGPMMGSVEENWDSPISKTTSAIIVLPKYHSLIGKKTRKPDTDLKLTRAICCQCTACTDMCPKNILGLNVQPHKVMRGIQHENPSSIAKIDTVMACNNCNLCTMYACPMDLSPGDITQMVKQSILRKGVKAEKKIPYEVDDLRESKQVPTKRLISRLDLYEYNVDAPLNMDIYETNHVRIPLKQHIGKPAEAIVNIGDTVSRGQLIGEVKEGLGANVHASISGKVTNITDSLIEIKA